ncbi:hypothetical protein OQA88_12795 [Cercophora sp. LCS_1]
MTSMLELRTPNFNPYAVKYSPYYDSRLAVAASANYGIVGNGRLYCIGLSAAGVQIEKAFDTNDALYDLAWSEINENQVAVATGDGSIKLFDLGVDQFPVMNFHEHKREAFSVHWNPVTRDTFVSSSWDGTVKLWSPTRTASLKTLPIGCCTYSTAFAPRNPALISAASADSHLRVFDLRTPVTARYHLATTIPVHAPPNGSVLPHIAPSHPGGPLGPTYAGAVPNEILTHDWNKYDEYVIAAAGVDRVIRTFDIRNPTGGPVSILTGHDYAVRKLAWSPHARDILVSASYDMTVRVWSNEPTMPGAGMPGVPGVHDPSANTIRAGRQIGLMNRHTEFATGVDWCLFGKGGWVASVGWDSRVLIWDAHTLLGP